MVRKALGLLLPASVAVLGVSQWREIARYIKISKISQILKSPYRRRARWSTPSSP
jgi:hypothetical protein